MKKRLIILLALFVFALAAVYIFIPQNITVSHMAISNSNFSATNRVMHDNNTWLQWWPKGKPDMANGNAFTYNNVNYTLSAASYNAFTMDLKDNGNVYPTTITLLPLRADSVGIEWKTTFAASINPWKRIMQYRQAIEIKNNMVFLLGNLTSFLEKMENIYGLDIQRENIKKDTLLISTKATFNNYPTTKDVYSLIEKLRSYLSQKGLKETGYPMLNVSKLENYTYLTRVALPIDALLKDSGEFAFKQMPANGYILTATVKGGNAAIDLGLSQMETYMQDYRKSAIAIPFQSLITDRSKESDTTKWVTKIYYPIIR